MPQRVFRSGFTDRDSTRIFSGCGEGLEKKVYGFFHSNGAVAVQILQNSEREILHHQKRQRALSEVHGLDGVFLPDG